MGPYEENDVEMEDLGEPAQANVIAIGGPGAARRAAEWPTSGRTGNPAVRTIGPFLFPDPTPSSNQGRFAFRHRPAANVVGAMAPRPQVRRRHGGNNIGFFRNPGTSEAALYSYTGGNRFGGYNQHLSDTGRGNLLAVPSGLHQAARHFLRNYERRTHRPPTNDFGPQTPSPLSVGRDRIEPMRSTFEISDDSDIDDSPRNRSVVTRQLHSEPQRGRGARRIVDKAVYVVVLLITLITALGGVVWFYGIVSG